jgi:hypothetical protein
LTTKKRRRREYFVPSDGAWFCDGFFYSYAKRLHPQYSTVGAKNPGNVTARPDFFMLKI